MFSFTPHLFSDVRKLNAQVEERRRVVETQLVLSSVELALCDASSDRVSVDVTGRQDAAIQSARTTLESNGFKTEVFGRSTDDSLHLSVWI